MFANISLFCILSLCVYGVSVFNSLKVDLQDRRSRRDMSPQGRKRAAGMVAKDYRTVSGVGQGFHNQMSAEVTSSRAQFPSPSSLSVHYNGFFSPFAGIDGLQAQRYDGDESAQPVGGTERQLSGRSAGLAIAAR